MSIVSLSDALTREHRDIDTGIRAFVVDLERGVVSPEPLLSAFEALRRHSIWRKRSCFRRSGKRGC